MSCQFTKSTEDVCYSLVQSLYNSTPSTCNPSALENISLFHAYARQNNMWILDRLEIARQRADLMFGSIAEDSSLGIDSLE